MVIGNELVSYSAAGGKLYTWLHQLDPQELSEWMALNWIEPIVLFLKKRYSEKVWGGDPEQQKSGNREIAWRSSKHWNWTWKQHLRSCSGTRKSLQSVTCIISCVSIQMDWTWISKFREMSLNVWFCVYVSSYVNNCRKAGHLRTWETENSIFCHFCMKNYLNSNSLILCYLSCQIYLPDTVFYVPRAIWQSLL